MKRVLAMVSIELFEEGSARCGRLGRMARAFAVVALLGLAACGADGAAETSDVASAQTPQRSGAIEWQLVAEPTTLSMRQRDSFVLRIVATNRGSGVTDTERDALALNVNGEDSMAFALAFGNGVREQRWSALPAGQSVSEERRGLALFDQPGDYELLLHRGERVFARVRVRVTAAP